MLFPDAVPTGIAVARNGLKARLLNYTKLLIDFLFVHAR